MAFGEGPGSDNSVFTQIADAGTAQQASDLAGARMASENVMQTVPMGNPVMVAGLHDVSIGGGGGSGDETDGTGRKLDKNKNVGQLISAGMMEQVEAPQGAPRAEAAVLRPGEQPQVTVTYSDATDGKTPDFIVKQDGTIQATGDPAASHKKDVVIQVERAPGSTANPGAEQQQSIDGLVNYLYGRYSSDNPAVAQNGLKLNDQYGLISDNVSQQVAARPTADDAATTTAAQRQNFAPQTQSAMSMGNRFTPGSSGTMSRSDIDDIIPERSQPRVQNETDPVADIKNALAGEFRPDKATAANANAPYETVRMDRRGTQEVPAVGRYGMTYPIIRTWFAMNFEGDDDFDDDSIVGKMDALAKAGKVSKAFAAKFHNKAFAHKFVNAMHQMKAGKMPSKEDMKELMPAQLQEQITADVVGKFAQAAPGDPGKVALAFHLGKSPDQLTAAEQADKGNKDFIRTANTFASASHLRDGMGTSNSANYTVSENGTLLDAKIKQAALSTAQNMGGSKSEGLCATGVQRAWAKAGFSELLGSGDGWQMHHKLDRDPNFVAVDRETAYAAVRNGHAAIVCRQWASNGNGAGHVETLMADKNGNIMGASDYHGAHKAQNNYYNWRNDKFYLPKQDVQNA